MLGVDGHVVLGDDGHLLRVHLIAVDEVAEEAGVRVGEVEGLVEDEVGVVAEVGVEGVVLQVRGVEVVARELVAAVLADDALEVVHGEEVGVVPARRLEGHREGGVQHLVVPLVEERGGEIGLLRVGHLRASGGGDRTEEISHLGGQCLSAEVSCPGDDDIFADVVGLVELLGLFGSDGVDDVLDAVRGLPQEVIPEGSVMGRLRGDGVGVHRGGSLVDGRLQCLDLDGLEGGLQDDLREQLDCLGEEGGFEGESVLGEFPGDVDVQLAAEGLDQLIDLVLGVLGGAGE